MAIPESKEILQNLAALATVFSFFVLLITLFHQNKATLPEIILLVFFLILAFSVAFIQYELSNHIASHKKTYKEEGRTKKMMRGKKGALSPAIIIIVLVGLLILYVILKYGI